MFTPAPWVIYDNGDSWDICDKVYNDWIARVYADSDRAEANVQLIALSPIMLDGLQTLEQTLRNLANGELTGYAKTIALNAASYASEIIQKATYEEEN